MDQDANTLRLRQAANRLLWACIVSGIASFLLFIPAFQNIGGRGYGIAALLFAGCSIYCNYRRREIEREIQRRVR